MRLRLRGRLAPDTATIRSVEHHRTLLKRLAAGVGGVAAAGATAKPALATYTAGPPDTVNTSLNINNGALYVNAEQAGTTPGVGNLFGGALYGGWTQEFSGLKAQTYYAATGGVSTYFLFNSRIAANTNNADPPLYTQGAYRPLLGFRFDYLGMALVRAPIVSGASGDTANVGVSTSLYVSATTGRVGIGTESPQSTLHVAGDLRVDGSLDGIRSLFVNTEPGGIVPGVANVFGGSFSGGWSQENSGLKAQLYYAANGSSSAYLLFNGRIVEAPGTAYPPQYTAGPYRPLLGLRFTSEGLSVLRAPIQVGANGDTADVAVGSALHVAAATGRVGIGTEAPQSTLHVSGDLRVDGTIQGTASQAYYSQ